MAIKAEALTGGFTNVVLDSQKSSKIDGRHVATGHGSDDRSSGQPTGTACAFNGCRAAGPLRSRHSHLAQQRDPKDRRAKLDWFPYRRADDGRKQDARFAIVEAGSSLPALGAFAQGSQEYPDRSTTIIIELRDIDNGPELALSGQASVTKT